MSYKMSKYTGWRDKGLETQLKQSIKIAKANKYNAKRVQIDGIWFDSKAEAKRYNELKLMEKAGRIAKLECHPQFVIRAPNGNAVCSVVLDFAYWTFQEGTTEMFKVHEDVKGQDNPLSKLKRKLVEAFYGIKVEVIK